MKLLLQRGAPVNVTDDTWGTPPLGGALHGWSEAAADERGRFLEVVALLVAAGAVVRPDWLDDDVFRSDPQLVAALRVTRDA